ncbi:histidine kinase dimerization/phospho-acceptor domain-containing protein [Dactylosporangium sp. NPDC000244]|uniref:sensor histidine kinase n=1 Tax=Dactylosporangium sp. NPDC000244 TaxID=3154365 RepID=UPI00332C141C
MDDEPADNEPADNEPATDLAQLRTEFIRVASHELRTPLTSIITFATMLESSDDALPLTAEDRQAAIGVIRRNAEHMQVIVADLLLLSSLETAESPLDLAPLPVPELLDFPGVPLHCAAGPDLLGDRVLLRELFHTAVQIVTLMGAAEIEASFAGGRWCVVVSAATSAALTPERLLSMRIPHPEQPDEHRTGALALMLGREIAARHGGSMVTSVDRPGVTVRISLPIR